MRFIREIIVGVSVLLLFCFQIVRIGILVCCPTENESFDPEYYDEQVIQEWVSRDLAANNFFQPEFEFNLDPAPTIQADPQPVDQSR